MKNNDKTNAYDNERKKARRRLIACLLLAVTTSMTSCSGIKNVFGASTAEVQTTKSTEEQSDNETELIEAPASDFEYEYDDNYQGIKITKYLGSAKKLIIPKEIDGKPVKAFYDYSYELGDDSIRGNRSTTDVTIQCDFIDPYAFSHWETLENVTLADGGLLISNNAFEYCTSLKNITLKGTAGIGDEGFLACSSLTKIELPDEMVRIGDRVFCDCVSLSQLELPASLTEIGAGAFTNCYELTNAAIPDSVTNIGNGAYINCTKLASVSLPKKLRTIYPETFKGCTALTEIKLPDGLTAIEEKAFFGSGLKSVTIPASVTRMRKSVFEDCSELEKVTVENGVTDIGWRTFVNCTSLKSIALPESVTVIEKETFVGCSSLTEITFSEKLNHIGKDAFKDCDALSVTYKGKTYNSDNFNELYDLFEQE